MIGHNMIGRGITIYERPLEPPDGYYYTDDEPEEDQAPDWVNDDEHSYILKGGKVIRYD